MFGIVNIKGLLLGLLLACPPVAAWLIGSEKPSPAESVQLGTTISNNQPVQVPVEIVTKGSEPQWVYVEVQPHITVPEPGISALMVVGSLLIFRRTRKTRENSR